MPSSSNLMDGEVSVFLREHGDWGWFLDIGPGSGKWGRLVRGTRNHGVMTRIVAVEPVQQYVDDYHLRDLYDEVRVARSESLLDEPNLQWDCAILGDVIEHLPKSHGVDLLHYLIPRTRAIVVVWPVETPSSSFFQGAALGHKEEGHISLWRDEEFHALGAKTMKSHELDGAVHVAFVPGYRR